MGTRTAARPARRTSSPSPSSSVLLPPSPAALRLSLARTGDHVGIHRLLISVFHGPSAAEFHAQLEEPGYEANQRVVVRDGNDVVAHLRLAPQVISIAGQTLPAARLMDLATAPEYRSRGLATALISAAERAAVERGALLGLTRTRVPRLFARLGWSLCGRHVFSSAAPRAILAALGATSSGMARQPAPLLGSAGHDDQPVAVRPFRRIDLPAITRLYEERRQVSTGWPVRSEAYFEWLVARGACDQIYVAAKGPEVSDLAKLADSIVGYAFVRHFRIVELVTALPRPDVGQLLLARVCSDSTEQDGWLVRCDQPAESDLHAILQQAGGQLTNTRDVSGEVFMAKLLDPLTTLRAIAPAWLERAGAAGLPKPVELGMNLKCGSDRLGKGLVESYRLRIGRRAVQINTGGPSRHRLSLLDCDLAPLLLGDRSARDYIESGRMKVNSRKAKAVCDVLFPGKGWWRPPLDDLVT